MTTASTKAAKAPVGFVLPEDGPPLVRAAALALAVARYCKADSWAQFARRVAESDDNTLVLLADLDVTESDAALIVEHEPVLNLLTVKPLVTVAVCPECQAWVLVAGQPPTKCKVTLRCTGKPVKASVAVREKPKDPEPASEPSEAAPSNATTTTTTTVTVTVTETTAQADDGFDWD